MIFYKDLRLLMDNNRQKTLKGPFYKSFIEIITLEVLAFSQKPSWSVFQVLIIKTFLGFISK